MLCSQNFLNTYGIHYLNKRKVVVIHYDLPRTIITKKITATSDVEQDFFTLCGIKIWKSLGKLFVNFFVDKMKKKI